MALRVRVFGVSCIVLLAFAFLLASCGSASSPGTGTSLDRTATSDTASTLGGDWIGTSSEHRAGTDAGLRLGDAVISYFQGKTDRAAVDVLVAPTALKGLDQMVSLLVEPTASSVPETGGPSARPGRTKVLLEFRDAKSQDAVFTLTIEVHADATTITAIEPGNTVESIGSSSGSPSS
jgi:hypothetical protein